MQCATPRPIRGWYTIQRNNTFYAHQLCRFEYRIYYNLGTKCGKKTPLSKVRVKRTRQARNLGNEFLRQPQLNYIIGPGTSSDYTTLNCMPWYVQTFSGGQTTRPDGPASEDTGFSSKILCRRAAKSWISRGTRSSLHIHRSAQ